VEQATRLQRVALDLMQVPQSEIDLTQDLTADPNAGIVKLLSNGQALESAGIRGGGAYYDFVRRDQRYGYGSDVALQDGSFRTGFAGADYGFILRLGTIPIRDLLVDSADEFPSSVHSSLHEAWRFMWEYRPPREIKEIRQHQRGARTKAIGNSTVSEKSVVQENASYLLRSVQVDDHDILVAMHVQRILPDRSVILTWKILKIFDTPVASGRED
jgi:hypothetical protein